MGRFNSTLGAILVFALIVLLADPASAGLRCATNSLRALFQRGPAREAGAVPPATPETVAANVAAYQQLRGAMRTSVVRASESGQLKVVSVTRAEDGTITGYELLPPNIVPGRYYSAIRLPDGSIAIGEFEYRNGIHTAMSKAFGGRPRELSAPDGLACGGIIFYDTGALVGGFCRNYPGPKNLRDLSRELKRMGIRVDSRSTAGRITETNPPVRRVDVDEAPMKFGL